MKIKLLHAVLRDGKRVEAGMVGDIDPVIAEELIASGAAVAVEEPKAEGLADGDDTGNLAPKEPDPKAQPEADTGAKTEPAPTASPAAPAGDTEKKPAKEGK